MNLLAFANPWLLAGLFAVGLPVVIHYLTRARPRRILFPPYQFLVEACAGRQVMHRLRTLVLLAVRCLAVLALVLLFARPFLKPVGAAGEAEAARRVVIILDSSLSMQAAAQGMPLFTRAQAEAADILRTLDPGSEAAIILAGSKSRPLLPALSRNLAALHDELIKARPTFEMGDPAAAMALAGQMLAGRGTIHVFSDFQESNWKSVRELPAGILCRLHPVAAAPVDNLAITGARIVPSLPVVDEPVEVICTVFNGTARPRQETVRLELGELTQERLVSLPPFGSAEAGFTVSFPATGILTGKASLPPDDLPEDDTRYLAVRVQRALQVLLISDADTSDPRGAAFFISHALVPSPEAAPGLNLVCRHSQDADRGVLETSDIFLLASPATLNGETVDVISRRVNEGAQLIVFLDAPNPDALVSPAFSPPFTLLQPAASDEGETLVAGPRRLFADIEAADWGGMKFHRYYRTQINSDRTNEVFLAHADGSAALTVSPVGKGMAAFINVPITPDGGDLIGSPLFPSTLHELLRLMRRTTDEESVTPGNAWTIEAPAAGDASVRVNDPAQRMVPAKIISSGRLVRLAMPPAAVPGIYTVEQAGKVIAAAAVNIDPRESDTRPVALEAIEGLPGARVSVVRNDSSPAGEPGNRPLWPLLALAAAALLALEMILLAVWRGPRAGFSPVALPGRSEPARALEVQEEVAR